MLNRPSKAVMAWIVGAVGALVAVLTQPFVSHDVGYAQVVPGQKSRKVRHLMLNRPFKSAIARAAIFALVLALAIPFVSGGLTSAQEAEDPPCKMDGKIVTCDYDENGNGPAADFSAIDPEGSAIDWSVEGTDKDSFSIDSNGVLMFEMSPNYEDPKDLAHESDADNDDIADFEGDTDDAVTNNVYVIKVRATDAPEDDESVAKSTELLVRVTVKNVDEDGVASINWLQPEVGVALMASASDPDTLADDGSTVDITFVWEWTVPKVSRPDLENNNHWILAGAPTTNVADYTPAAADENKYLRAMATYTDGDGADKKLYVKSDYPVRAAQEPNDAPNAFNSQDNLRAVDENSAKGILVGGPVATTDSNSDVLTYTIPPTSDANPFAIDKRTGQITVAGTVHHEDVDGNGGTYEVTVTATDPSGEDSSLAVTITANDVNEKPTVTGSAEESILEIDSTPEDEDDAYVPFTQTYTKADDDDGDTTKFSLEGDDAAAFKLTPDDNDDTMTALTFRSEPNNESPTDANKDNLYKVTVVATDADGLTGQRTVSVTVTDVPEDGSVNLSAIQPAAGVAIIAELDEPDNGVTGEKWQWQNSETGVVTSFVNIEGATSATYTPKAAVDDDDATTNVDESDPGDEGKFLRATVSYRDDASPTVDNADTLDTDESKDNTEKAMGDSENAVRLEPDTNDAPMFESASMMREVAENSDADAKVGDPVTADDPDLDPLTYTFSGGADMASFEIDRDSGQITVGAGTKLDFEGSQTSYEVEVTADDPFGESVMTMVTIMVTDMNEAPAFEADDPDDYDENGMGPVAMFTATDPEGADIDWSVEGTDKDSFSIDSNGVLMFKMSPNFEDPKDLAHESDADIEGDTDDAVTNNIYVVKVRAAEVRTVDAEGPTKFTEIQLRVTVKNVDEDGVASINWLQPEVGVALMASASDPDTQADDGSAVDITFVWEWTVPKVSRPDLENNKHWTLAGATTTNVADYTPAAADEGQYLRAMATYTDGDGADKKLYAKSDYPVRAAQEPNDAPNAFNSQDNLRAVDENSAKGTLVGVPVTTTDSNADVLTYTIPPTSDANPFAIDKRTGQIMVAGTVHHEDVDGNGGTYEVTVTATDPSGEDSSLAVTITANDVNEKPTVTGSAEESILEIDSTPEDEDDAYVPFTQTYTKADDDDGDTTTFSLQGDDAAAFKLTPDDNDDTMTALTFRSEPNNESPTDANRDNLYKVTVVATDADGLTGERTVSVTVTDVPEDGSVNLSTIQPAIGVPITAELDEPDNGVTGEKWQWKGSISGAEGSFVDIEGATSTTYTPKAAAEDDEATTNVDESDLGDEGKYLQATVSYRDDASPTMDDTNSDNIDESEDNTEKAMGDSENAVRVEPDTNDAPMFESASMMREVAENSDADAKVGDPVTADDPDLDPLSYTITGGADMASFEIDRDSGQITVGAGTMLDFEGSQTSYEVEVTADDPFGESDSTIVTIMVTDMNEAPVLTLEGDEEPVTPPVTPTMEITGDDAVDYEENGTDAVATYTSTIATPTWTLLGVDMDDFSISGGVLSFSSSPDYEAPTDENNDNVYMVTVVASNGGGEVANLAVTVTVTNDMSDDETTPPDTFDPLSYDGVDKGGNENGEIDRPEVIKAIRDYFADMITREQVIAVITAYFN